MMYVYEFETITTERELNLLVGHYCFGAWCEKFRRRSSSVSYLTNIIWCEMRVSINNNVDCENYSLHTYLKWLSEPFKIPMFIA